MTIQEIENMTYDELKTNRTSILLALQELTKEELISRYLQARMDAKLRDTKLYSQGLKITELTEKVNSLMVDLQSYQSALAESQTLITQRDSRIAELEQQLTECTTQHNAETMILKEQIAAEIVKADQYKTEARRNINCIKEIAQQANDCLAQMVVESINKS